MDEFVGPLRFVCRFSAPQVYDDKGLVPQLHLACSRLLVSGACLSPSFVPLFSFARVVFIRNLH